MTAPFAAPAWPAIASALIEGLPDAAWLIDARDLRLVAANRAAEAMHDAAPGALCGRAVQELVVTPEDIVFWREVATSAAPLQLHPATGVDEPHVVGLHSDTYARSAGGGLCPVRRRVSRVRLSADTACYLVLLQDRRAQRRSEAEHAARLAQLNATLEATVDGILVTDAAGRIVNFNRRFALLWALPAELLRDRDDDEVLASLQRAMADPGGYMRRLAAIDEACAEPSRDVLALADGRCIERAGSPQRSEGRTVGRVWSFREAA